MCRRFRGLRRGQPGKQQCDGCEMVPEQLMQAETCSSEWHGRWAKAEG
jgi:hypothetical protein